MFQFNQLSSVPFPPFPSCNIVLQIFDCNIRADLFPKKSTELCPCPWIPQISSLARHYPNLLPLSSPANPLPTRADDVMTLESTVAAALKKAVSNPGYCHNQLIQGVAKKLKKSCKFWSNSMGYLLIWRPVFGPLAQPPPLPLFTLFTFIQ